LLGSGVRKYLLHFKHGDKAASFPSDPFMLDRMASSHLILLISPKKHGFQLTNNVVAKVTL
jgi:hypothetical protein